MKVNKVSLMVLSIMLVFSTASFAAITIEEDATVGKFIIETNDLVEINGAYEDLIIESNVEKANVIINKKDGQSIEREILNGGKLEIESNLKESLAEYEVKFVLTPEGAETAELRLYKDGILVENGKDLPATFKLKFGKYEFELEKGDVTKKGEIRINSSEDIKLDFDKIIEGIK